MAAGTTAIFEINTILSPKEIDTLTLTFGNPQATGTGQPGLQLNMNSVAAVPVPAAGFLLVGALGGLATLRRRKAAALAA